MPDSVVEGNMMEVVILEDYAQNPIITSTVNHNVENKKNYNENIYSCQNCFRNFVYYFFLT